MRRSSNRPGGSCTGKPYQPTIGTDIEIDDVPAIEAKTRGFLARFVAICVAVAVAVSGVDGLVTGRYAALEIIWAVAGPLVGAVMALLLWCPLEGCGMTAVTMTSSAQSKAKQSADDRTKIAKNRVQFDLPPRSMERLNALKLKTEASSYAEVVKNALRLYEALIEETDSGKQFLVRDANGQVSPYRLFL